MTNDSYAAAKTGDSTFGQKTKEAKFLPIRVDALRARVKGVEPKVRMDIAVKEQASQINALIESNVNPAGSTKSFDEESTDIMPFPGDIDNTKSLGEGKTLTIPNPSGR